MTGSSRDAAVLDSARLNAALPIGGRWWIEVVDDTASTNADVAARAAAGEREGLVLLARRQTAGRGRQGRTWEGGDGAGLAFSLLVRPEVPASRWGWLPLLAGVAVAEASGAQLKWPNDLLTADGKVGGILSERVDSPAGPAGVVGIGLNVTAAPPGVPGAAALGPEVNRADLLVAVLASADAWLARWVAADGDAEFCGLAGAYRRACVTVGRDVSVTLPGRAEPIVGRAFGIDDMGRLVVRRDVAGVTYDPFDECGGREVAVAAGDVEHVR